MSQYNAEKIGAAFPMEKTQIWVCAIYTVGGQAQTSLRKSLLRGIEKLALILPCQRIEPRVFGLNSRALPFEVCPLSVECVVKFYLW